MNMNIDIDAFVASVILIEMPQEEIPKSFSWVMNPKLRFTSICYQLFSFVVRPPSVAPIVCPFVIH